ncbi:hypothetical protein BDV59DRAFT_207213 [Aspergillus ambiguus]|uniref:uncharacterized protein n=1 Tax=Aspergillus ambiguus TaxID=176160 RepID=UPI003CCD7F4A
MEPFTADGLGLATKWTCQYCSESFVRKEHLRRHESSHLGLRPFRCETCSRMFARRDTLKKHQRTHFTESDSEEQSCAYGHRRSQKACLNCAKAKQRCNNKLPCRRCVNKNIRCTFPTSIPAAEDLTFNHTSEASQSTLFVDEHNTSIQSGLDDYVALDILPVHGSHLSFEGSATAMEYNQQQPEDHNIYSIGNANEYEVYPEYSSLPNHGCDEVTTAEMVYTRLPTEGLSPTGKSLEEVSSSCQNGITEHEQSPSAHSSCCTQFPETQPDEDVIATESYGHVRPISDSQYKQIWDFWKIQQCHSCTSPFISPSFLNAMVQLYFEHHNPWMPFLHPGHFDSNNVSWLLILAVASVGCQYSSVNNSEVYVLALQDLLQRALPKDATEALSFDQATLAQCLLLRNTSLLFSGYEDDILTSEYERNMLITITKSIADKITNNTSSLGALAPYERWRQWVELESQRRTVYCVWVIECCYWMFKDAPSSMDLDDFHVALPCKDILWISNPELWQQHLMANQDTMDGISLKTAFSNPDLLNRLLDDSSDLTNVVILLAFYTEERRLLRSSQPWFAADISTGLKERKLYKWPDDLTSFRTAVDDKCEPTIRRFAALRSVSNNTPTFIKVIYHVTNIMRRTPLSCLYALSGWQVTVEQMAAAATSLSHWMQQNPVLARETFLQAAALYSALHGETGGAGCHHLAFLVAALYIWAYCIVGKGAGVHPIAHETHETRQTSQPLRLDKDVPDDVKESWVRGTLDAPIYVKSAGIVNGTESAIRVLKGFRCSLANQRSWHSLRHGLIYAISEMIDGRFASHSPELRSRRQRKSAIGASQD